jgi:hypothetical protein
MTNQGVLAWGHPDRHYFAAAHPGDGKVSSPRGPRESSIFAGRWETVLDQTYPTLRETVERCCKQWNNILRDYMRTETGLRLTVGGRVSVRSGPCGGRHAQAIRAGCQTVRWP